MQNNESPAIDPRVANLELGNLPAIPAPKAYSLVGECLVAVACCTTLSNLDAVSADFAAPGSVFGALSRMDKEAVRAAWSARRIEVTAETTPVAPATTIAEDLSAIAAISTAVAATLPTARRGRVALANQNPTQIAAAILTARAAGARLAGYSGQIVDPNDSKGIGTIIAFGSAIREYDTVADRDRQVLIPWSDVESVRVAMGLPEKAFGRAPGNVGLLGKATQILNHGGYVARNVRPGKGIRSAWKIGYFDNRIDSQSMGQREALITLSATDEISCDHPDHPGAAAVLADYDRRVGGTLIASDDLRTRIEACFAAHYGARSTDLGLYVSPYNAARAVDLVVALRPVAGRKIYAWSHTDKGSISEALCDSFSADLERLETACTGKASASLIERIEALKGECVGLARVMGNDVAASYRARLDACDAMVTNGLDSTSQRALQLEMT